MENLVISVGIVAFNEENYIETLLNLLLAQDYPKKQTEILLINSLSTDKTEEIFEQFREQNIESFYDIKVIENKGKIQSAGWNEAIRNFSGDALIRLDAHARIENNFIRKNAETLLSGEMVCGGKRPNLPAGVGGEALLVHLADASMFGGSFAKYHSSEEKTYVDTVFHGCYRREVLEKVGFFNEDLGRTEDNDFHSRIRKAGYKICYNPEIVSYQFSRGSAVASIRQKYGNGYWIGRTIAINPDCISLFHFVPFIFVLGLIAASVFCVITPWLLILASALYGVVNLALSGMSFITSEKKHLSYLLLPIMFLSLHLSYGIGTFAGLFSLITKQVRK